MKDPKIYLLESGRCKLERRYDFEIQNPLNRGKVLFKETHWIPICVLEPGTLMGEEVLLYHRHHEQYKYRVTVSVIAHSVTDHFYR